MQIVLKFSAIINLTMHKIEKQIFNSKKYVNSKCSIEIILRLKNYFIRIYQFKN